MFDVLHADSMAWFIFVKRPFMVPFFALHSVFRGLRRKGFFHSLKSDCCASFLLNTSEVCHEFIKLLYLYYFLMYIVKFFFLQHLQLCLCSVFKIKSKVFNFHNFRKNLTRFRGRCYTADDGVFAVFIKICYLWKKTKIFGVNIYMFFDSVRLYVSRCKVISFVSNYPLHENKIL